MGLPRLCTQNRTESGRFDARANASTELGGQCLNYLANDGVRFFMHFSIRRILNRVLNKYAMRIRHTQGVCLSRCRRHELRRSNGYRWCSLNLKPYRVMQTARGT